MTTVNPASTATSRKLRELIRGVRACKTMQEERSLINQQTAAIRDNFKSDKNNSNTELHHLSVMKLIFITLLGYKTQFGQVMCIKLMASSNFRQKRIGYLGLSQLLWQTSDIILMVTQSIKRDLQSSDILTISLALSAIGQVSNNEMCRQLYPAVIKLTEHNSSIVKQKALTAAIRIVRKLPDTIDQFVEVLEKVLSDNNNGVLLGALSLMHNIMLTDSQYIANFKPKVSFLVRQAKNLSITGYANDYEIGGVKDPFLQVKIIQCLKVLAQKDAKASQQMSDVLASLVSNIQSNKNAANTVIYQAVRAIMQIQSSHGLRVYGINILSRFLDMKDNNLRFIALSTLQNVVSLDRNAVQRHKQTILQCVKDNDIALKRRALDLLICISDETNVRSLVKQLGQLFESVEMPFLQDLANGICEISDKYSPSMKFYIDSAIKVFTWAGHVVKPRYSSQLIRRISSQTDIRTYATFNAYQSLNKFHTQNALARLGCWLIGQYGHLLIGQSFNPSQQNGQSEEAVIKEEEVFELLNKVLQHFSYTHQDKDIIILEYAINALGKLSVRYPQFTERVQELIQPFTSSYYIEVQQRACEYLKLLQENWVGSRDNIFKIIPQDQENQNKKPVGELGTHYNKVKETNNFSQNGNSLLNYGDADEEEPVKQQNKQSNAVTNVLNLLQDLDLSPSPVQQQPSFPAPEFSVPTQNLIQNPPTTTSSLFSSPPAQPIQQLAQPPSNNLLFGQQPAKVDSGLQFGQFQSASAELDSLYLAFEDERIKIQFKHTISLEAPEKVNYIAYFSNKTMNVINKPSIQVAGVKYLKLSMKKANKDQIQPMQVKGAQQEFSVVNSQHGNKKIVLKVKVIYSIDGQQYDGIKALSDVPQ